DFLGGGEQPDLADVLEEELQGIGGHVRLQVERLLARATALAVGPLGLGGRPLRRAEVLDQLDAVLLEVAVEVPDVGLVELHLGDGAGDVAEGQHAELLALGDQRLYLFKLLNLRYQHSPTLFLPGCLPSFPAVGAAYLILGRDSCRPLTRNLYPITLKATKTRSGLAASASDHHLLPRSRESSSKVRSNGSHFTF